ncbi:MAG: SLC13 family permease, partial [Candidatus Bipolaricaulia bacterium]
MDLLERLRPQQGRLISLLLALFLLLAAILLPPPPGLSREGARMVGIMLTAVVLWIAEPIPLPVTGLLVMFLQPLLGIMRAGEVFSGFGNKAVFFLLGSLMLAAAVEKHGLHRRVALKVLSWFERSPRLFILGVMVVGAALSFGLEEHAVAALLLPILMHILVTMKLIPRRSNFGIASMLALTYGTSIGSWGTLLGGARNPLTVGFLSEVMGYNVTFLGWMRMSLPVVLISLPLAWLILIKFFPPEVQATELRLAREEVAREVRELGPLGRPEWLTLGVYLTTIGLWMGFSARLGVAVIAM